MAVVRYDNQRPFELYQRFGQRTAHVEIEVVGRFIKQQQVRALPDDQRQHQTGFFAPEKRSVFSVTLSPRKPKPPR